MAGCKFPKVVTTGGFTDDGLRLHRLPGELGRAIKMTETLIRIFFMQAAV